MSMWTDKQRQRYNLLREREDAGRLTAEERAELAALMQALSDHEAAYLGASNERKAREIAETAAAVGRLEAQNRELREYLRVRQAFLKRVKSLVADIQAEDRRMRERFANVIPLLGEPSSRKPS
jgi:phage-related minor tail protein